MDSFQEAWGMICDYCKQRVTDVAYKTWISRISPVKIDFDTGDAILMVPNDFHRQTLTRCYKDLLNEAAAQIFGSNIEVNFVVPEEEEGSGSESENEPVNLEYEYTFDNFIVGSSNKFAHAASLAVAANPAGAYNPLFVYGNSGLGKTHILYAISNEIKKNRPDMKTLYVKGDTFTVELIDSIKHGTTGSFKNKYRKTDLLLVDDIQFIAGKDSTQEEFFHTFNFLFEANKQIVMTSDRPPKDIKTLEDRLRTRFEWGLIADIQPPDFETRVAIIKRKCELINFDLPEETIQYIAENLKTNIRQLEGTVKNLKANYYLREQSPTIPNTKITISKLLSEEVSVPATIDKIVREVSRTYNVDEQDIMSSKRSADISNARKIAVYIVRQMTDLSTNQIGKEFGGRDHSTIVYSLRQMEAGVKNNSNLRSMVDDIIKNVGNG